MSDVTDLKVLIVATEVYPFVKSGDLGNVVGSLPKVLCARGVDARIVLPFYETIRLDLLKDLEYRNSFGVSLGWCNLTFSIYEFDAGVPAYLIYNDYYFRRDEHERFAFFSKAAVEFLSTVNFQPDVIHFNDWQTGLGCMYLRDMSSRLEFYSQIKSLYTIHNLQYQGVFGREVLSTICPDNTYFSDSSLEFYGNISYMKAGLMYANAISTISETYAKEIQTPQYGHGMDGIIRNCSDKVYGILNGIDNTWANPETNPFIFEPFGQDNLEAKKRNKHALQEMLGLPQRDVPMISIISELVDQKGLELVAFAMDELMSKDIQLVVLGTGEIRYENLFKIYAWQNPTKMSASIMFSEELAQKIYVASDLLLIPSLFEHCGLGQLFSLRYGTIPIVLHTGGFVDTITHYDATTHTGNGFVFEDYFTNAMVWAIHQALSLYENKEEWNHIMLNAMSCDFSWDKSAEKYIDLYLHLKKRLTTVNK